MSNLLERAEAFARRVHEGQFRKGEAKEPYTVHLEEVVDLVSKHGGSDTEVCAAWLHDTVEDCPPTSFQDIEENFGIEVGKIVSELTDDKNLKKAERKRLQVINASHKSRLRASLRSVTRPATSGPLQSLRQPPGTTSVAPSTFDGPMRW